MIRWYKLTTGQTILATFKEVTVFNDRKNLKAHVLSNAVVLDPSDVYKHHPWLLGVQHPMQEFLMPADVIIMYVETGIDEVLVESYIKFLTEHGGVIS